MAFNHENLNVYQRMLPLRDLQACETKAGPATSAWLGRLRARLEADFASMRGHKLTDAEESKTYARLTFESYSKNVGNAEDLRKAKASPERYQDLTVRISGFSARFVNLDSKWQDAIIERTAQRM